MHKDELNISIPKLNSDDYGTFHVGQHTPTFGKFSFSSSTIHQPEHVIDGKFEQTTLKKSSGINEDIRQVFFNHNQNFREGT